ncbi:MAG: hypothetical protein ABIJ92_00555 [Candidatus Aenigmatarchaeota archaeon]
MADVDFKTVKAEEIKFGKNNFLEVARKKAVTEEGETEFIAISRGFFSPDGSKRFKKSIALPDEKEIRDFVSKKILEL